MNRRRFLMAGAAATAALASLIGGCALLHPKAQPARLHPVNDWQNNYG